MGYFSPSFWPHSAMDICYIFPFVLDLLNLCEKLDFANELIKQKDKLGKSILFMGLKFSVIFCINVLAMSARSIPQGAFSS